MANIEHRILNEEGKKKLNQEVLSDVHFLKKGTLKSQVNKLGTGYTK